MSVVSLEPLYTARSSFPLFQSRQVGGERKGVPKGAERELAVIPRDKGQVFYSPGEMLTAALSGPLSQAVQATHTSLVPSQTAQLSPSSPRMFPAPHMSVLFGMRAASEHTDLVHLGPPYLRPHVCVSLSVSVFLSLPFSLPAP